MTTSVPHKKPETVGGFTLLNRTGIAASPLDATSQSEAALAAPITPGDAHMIGEVRADYEREARPVGTMPPPMNVKGVAKSVSGLVSGTNPNVLMDRVAERIAFERTGVRLYDGLIAKYDARGSFAGGPSREDLVLFQQQELEHFQLLCTAMAMIGGDFTAMTPSADMTAVMSMGLVQVIADPRTTLAQALQAILVAELADNDGWQMLIDLTDDIGPKELVPRFEKARREEDAHLGAVRTWLAAYVSLAAHREDTNAPTS